MKTKLLFPTLFLAVISQLSPAAVRAQDIETMPPVVVKAVPESGSKTVPPGVTEIKVTFSKEMQDQTWSWASVWKDSTPEVIGKPGYEKDQRTCVLQVKLEPNKTYAYWINSQKFQNFKDKQGHAAVPYLLVFQTRDN